MMMNAASNVSLIHFCSYLISALCTVNVLVWANSSTIFVLSYLAVDHPKGPAFAGTLLLADEALSLLFVILWGRLVDRLSLRFVACVGHFITAVGLVAISLARNPLLELLPARLLFAVGHSALTTVLSAGFALITAPVAAAAASAPPPAASNDANDRGSFAEEALTETDPLLPESAARSSVDQTAAAAAAPQSKKPQRQATPASLYAGVGGLAAGCGALLAVFVFLPLPPKLAASVGGETDLARGLQKTYWLVAALEVAAVAVAFFGLNVAQASSGQEGNARGSNPFVLEARRLLKGFTLAKDREVLTSYLSSLVARAQTVTVALCVPILVNAYFIRSGQCKLDDPTAPPEQVKQGCHSAFALAAALTGTVQTVGLVSAPLAGYLGSKQRITRVIGGFAAFGAVGFLLYGFLPGQNPARLAFSLPASIIVGMSQTSSAVLGLAMTARARARLVQAETNAGQGEVAGAISAGVSFFSGCGVIVVGQTAGLLAEATPTSPFLLVAGLNAALVLYTAFFTVD